MQEYTSPGEVEVREDANLCHDLWENARAHPNRPALAYLVGGQFVEVSTQQFADTVAELAAGLIALGIEPGSKVCVFSRTRVEFTYLDYAIWAAGCVTVPIYETSSAEQVEWVVGDSAAVAVVCESPELKEVYDEVAGKLDKVGHVFVIDEGGLDQIRAEGSGVDRDQVMQRSQAVAGSDIATIVYTSGTTGRPKGCVITHHNFLWDSTQVIEAVEGIFAAGETTLLFLPLAHIFGRIVQVSCVRSGVKLGFFGGDVKKLPEELQAFQPTFLLSVPRVFEKVYNGARQRAADDGKGKIFDKAAQVAIDYSRAQTEGSGAGIGLKIQHAVFDKLVYSKLRAAVGGQVKYSVSGGAALGARLGHFFNGVGITILEAYGLTENTAGATINRPSAFKVGSVGKPIPGSSVRIDESGEVMLKGSHVFQGYWKNPKATKEVLGADGWFRTGDLGELDDQGFLSITGRKKELIVTAGGKNVAPAVLEDRMRAHALISQAMVVGDSKPFIAALVAIDAEAFPKWAEDHGKAGKSIADVADDPELKETVQAAVDDANKAVSKAESIREFRILPEDLTIDGGELTPTLKVKRDVVAGKYQHMLDDIYGTD